MEANNIFLKIYSNISSLIIKEDEARKNKEAEEKRKKEEAERDENFKIYGTAYPNDWMKQHKQDYIDGKYHGYRWSDDAYSDSAYNPDYTTIYFYEYSSIEGNQRKFFSISNFSAFCNDCNIPLSQEDKTKIKTNYTSYISCVPGKTDLIICSSFYGLKDKLAILSGKHAETSSQPDYSSYYDD